MSYAQTAFIPQRDPDETAEEWIDRAIYPLSQLASLAGQGGASVSAGRVYVGSSAAQGLLDIGIISGGNIVQVDSAAIVDAAITTAKLADLGVTNSKIANGTITAAELANLSVTEQALANAAIAARHFQPSAVDAAALSDLAVTAAKLADGSIDLAGGKTTGQIPVDKLADLAVTAAKLADGSIDLAGGKTTGQIPADKLADLAVTAAKLADGSVDLAGTKTTGQVSEGKLADLAVTAAKLADGSVDLSGTKTTGQVSEGKLADLAVTAAKLADGSVGESKVADAAITATKIASAAIGTAAIQNGAITNALIANAAVGTAAIQNGAITNALIANAAVGQAAIATAAIGTAAIQAGAITTALIDDATITDAKIVDAAVLTAKIADAAIVSAKIGDLEVTDAKINTVAANKLTAGIIATNQIYVGGTSFEIQGANKRIIIKDEQASPVTRVELGRFSGSANDHGIKIRDASGNLIMEAGAQAKLYGSNITTEALVVTDDGDGIAIKLNGTGTQARIQFDQTQFINGGNDDQLGINAGFSAGKSIICDSGAEFVINSDAGLRLSTKSNIQSANNNTLNQTFATGGSYNGNIVAAIMNRAATTSVNFFTATSNNAGSGDVEFLVRGDGVVASDGGTTMSSPADYAEYFETVDGLDILPGTTVVLEDGKVRAATNGENPIGVIRPADTSCVIGNAAWNHWSAKWLRDEFDRALMEPYSVIRWYEDRPRESAPDVFKKHELSYPVDQIPGHVVVPDNAEIVSVDESGAPLMRRVINPDFDAERVYTPRQERQEWVIVGLLGQVPIKRGQPTAENWQFMKERTNNVDLWFIK